VTRPIRLLLLLFALASAAAAETLSGVAVDSTGAVMPGAAVTLECGGRRLMTTAGVDGSFELEGVPAGPCVVEVAYPDFAPFERQVDVPDDSPVRAQLELEQATASVTVEGDAPDELSLEQSENRDAVEIDRGSIDRLPVIDGNIVEAFSTLLDSGLGSSEGGGLIVDGMETDKLVVTPSAIQDVRINKDPYSAEFSRPGSGRVEVITKKGQQEFHGEGNVRLRSAMFDARNAFATRRPEQRRFEAEGHVTGPIGDGGKNSFLISAEREIDDEQSIIFAQTPDGAVQDAVVSPEREFETSVRYDRHPNFKESFSTRYEWETEKELSSGVGGFRLPETASDEHGNEHSGYFRYTRVLGADRLFEASVRGGYETERETSRLDARRIIVEDAFTAGGAQTNERGHETYGEGNVAYSWKMGDHYLRTGAIVREIEYGVNNDRDNFGGTFRFATLADYEAGLPFSYSESAGQSRLAIWDVEFAAYIQDRIRLNDRVQISAGLRWDRQSYINDSNNFSPRISIATALDSERKTILRAGTGIFYDNIWAGLIGEWRLRDGVRLREILLVDPTYPDPFAGDASNTAPPPNVMQPAPGMKIPYLLHSSVSLERTIGSATASARYSEIAGIGLLRSRDLNFPIDGVRPDPTRGIVQQFEPSARRETRQLRLQLRGDISDYFDGSIRYTWGRSYDNVSDEDDLPPDSLDLSGQWGRADFDRRHRLDLVGSFAVPKLFDLGVIYRARSGAPYTITTGRDENGDGLAIERPEGVGRNTEQGFGYSVLDVRVSREFAVTPGDDPIRLRLSADAFNALNQVNFQDVVGNLSSPLFGRPVEADTARRLQFSARVRF